MAESTGTTRPARTRAASTRTAAAKPATTKTTAKPAAEPAPEVTAVTRFKVELEHDKTTKTYEKFVMPDSYKGTTVGSIYAPPGTARVVVLVIGADDTGE